jgi:hypothetical protein
MELISYEQFAKLRLRDFVPDRSAIRETPDWEWEGSFWFNESIGFTSFSRHVTTPDETGGLELSFSEMPAEFNQRLLSVIGLPVRRGMSHSEALSALGVPTRTHQFVRDRRSCEFTVGSDQPYVVGCTIQEIEGLIHVTIVRSDLVSRHESSN